MELSDEVRRWQVREKRKVNSAYLSGNFKLTNGGWSGFQSI